MSAPTADATLLTVPEVAARYQVKVSTIWRRCQQGRMVPPPVLERPYRFSPAQVQQVIDGTWAPPDAVASRRRFFARHARAQTLQVVR